MAGDAYTDDGPPPRPSIPRRRREGIVIEATLADAGPRRLRAILAAALCVGAALALAGVYWTRPGAPLAAESAGAEAEPAVAALRRRLRAGEPLANELAALERLGFAPAALAPLRRFAATGAPSAASLARAGLAKLRKVGESHAAEAGVAALQRGDLAAALAALADSPQARAAAGAWMEEAAARLAADEAAQALARKAATGPGDARR
jgi:hypothetical protein